MTPDRRRLIVLCLLLLLAAPVLAAMHHAEHDLDHDEEAVCELCLLSYSSGHGLLDTYPDTDPVSYGAQNPFAGYQAPVHRTPWLSQPVRAPPR